MAILDDGDGYWWTCDNCGLEVDERHKKHDDKLYQDDNDPSPGNSFPIIFGVWRDILKGRSRPDVLHGEWCRQCAIKVTPWVYRLRDIDELSLFVNNLERAIRGRQKRDKEHKDNRTIEDSTCKCCERCREWRHGY